MVSVSDESTASRIEDAVSEEKATPWLFRNARVHVEAKKLDLSVDLSGVVTVNNVFILLCLALFLISDALNERNRCF